MLITESHVDVSTSADGKEGSMSESPSIHLLTNAHTQRQLLGIFVFHPSIPGYPNA